MDLIQAWWGLVVLLAGVAAAGVGWRVVRRRRRSATSVPVAGLARVRALPGYRALAGAELLRRRVEAGCLVVALIGAALLASRAVAVGDDSREMRTRDVVLCLDVSGSMTEVDADVIDTYLALVENLREERIGFVVFDAYAVTVFPLTSDREYVVQELRRAKAALGHGPVAGTEAVQSGSSLIGDGLTTCVDQLGTGEGRPSRTVVLATDNEVAGDAVYTVPEAGATAERSGVMVFAVMPESEHPAQVDELRTVTQRTAGDVLVIDPGAATNVARISSAIKAQQRSALLRQPHQRSFDLIWPGALLLLLGLAGSLIAVWRRP